MLVVDDHPLLRDGVSAVIGTQTDMTIIGEAETGAQAITEYERLRPDVVLMDLQMPDLSGLEAIEAIRAADPQARILVLTTYAGDGRAIRALRSGASGYLLKGALRRDLLEAIRSIARGGRHLDERIARDIATHVLGDDLTARELQVLALTARGNSNKQIAAQLNVSDETVKGHMKMIFTKLQVADRTHAVTLAARRGLIDL